MTEAEKLAANLDYLRRFARKEKTDEGKQILWQTAVFCVDGLEAHIAGLEEAITSLRESALDWKGHAKRFEAELENIASSNYREWEEGQNTPESFVAWAKSRARHALKR